MGCRAVFSPVAVAEVPGQRVLPGPFARGAGPFWFVVIGDWGWSAGLQAGQCGGEQVGVGRVGGQAQVGSPGVTGDAGGDREQA